MMIDMITKELKEKRGEVPVRGEIFWDYEGLPDDLAGEMVYLRYKVFADAATPNNQQMTQGIFLARVTIPVYGPGTNEKGEREIKSYQDQIVSLSDYPEEFPSSITNEMMLNGDFLVHNGTARIGFINYDPTRANLKFQSADGPFLLVKETGFLANYVRAVVVIFLQIFVLSLISVSL